MTERTIAYTNQTKSSGYINVYFEDGSSCVTQEDLAATFPTPVQGGEVGFVHVVTRQHGGRDYDFLGYFGPKEGCDEFLLERVGDYFPTEEKQTMKFDVKDLSFYAQVAYKEACETARTLAVTTKDGDPFAYETLKAATADGVRIIMEVIAEAR